MNDQASAEVASRWHRDIYLRGNFDVADEICTPGLIAHGTGVAADAPHGPLFVRQDAAATREVFDIESMTDDDVIVSGDRVVIRWTMHGRHVGELLGVQPTGQRVSITGIDIFRMEGGRIAEFWGEYNQLDLAEQIGALGSEAASA